MISLVHPRRFSRDDVRNARAYAIKQGNNVGTRGRLHIDLLTQWVTAGRPVLVEPISTSVGTGKRGGPSTVNVEGNTHVVSKQDAQNARAWAVENELEVPTKGRLSTDILQKWADAGMPTYREESATVYYRALDKRGRANGKERIAIVYKDMLTRSGKPRMSDYWDALVASGITGIPVRIIAGAMKINVHRDDESQLVYEWVSKSDSKDVVDMLKANISLV